MQSVYARGKKKQWTASCYVRVSQYYYDLPYPETERVPLFQTGIPEVGDDFCTQEMLL